MNNKIYKLKKDNDMDKNEVTIYLVRHAESTANCYKANMGNSPDYSGVLPDIDYVRKENLFINASLSAEGFKQIFNKYKLPMHAINADFIFCSPIKRAIQTALLTYYDMDLDDKPIHILPLITEFGESPENIGVSQAKQQNDPEIICYKNYACIDWDQYFWQGNTPENKQSGEWWNESFRLNINKRISDLKIILSHQQFKNKSVILFTHYAFIKEFTGEKKGNYKMVEAKYDQITGDIEVIN